MTSCKYFLAAESDTVTAGTCLAAACGEKGLVVFLYGDLGAGKTTLTRGVLRHFGHTGAVKSPTYTLVEPYEVSGRSVNHFDLYRLGDPEELEYMGVRDYFGERSICLIEWPQRGDGVLPEADLVVTLEATEMSDRSLGRTLTLEARSSRGDDVLLTIDMPASLKQGTAETSNST